MTNKDQLDTILSRLNRVETTLQELRRAILLTKAQGVPSENNTFTLPLYHGRMAYLSLPPNMTADEVDLLKEWFALIQKALGPRPCHEEIAE